MNRTGNNNGHTRKTTGISLPQVIFDEIDTLSDAWHRNRSDTIYQIYREWKAMKAFMAEHHPDWRPTS